VTFESTADLRDAGFKGFHTVRDLRISRLAAVPEAAGVYLIVRPDRSPPEFLDISPAGYFKGRDPSVPLEELRGAWVAGSCTLYIGRLVGRAHRQPSGAASRRTFVTGMVLGPHTGAGARFGNSPTRPTSWWRGILPLRRSRGIGSEQ
jgi:hypothetical protein